MLARGRPGAFGRGTTDTRSVRSLFFVFVDLYRFEIFGLEDLLAVEAFDIIDTLSAGDHLCSGMVTSGLHSQSVGRLEL